MLTLLAFAVRKWPNAGWLFVIGIVAAVGALGGLITFDESSPYVGLSQRVIEVSVIGWVLACGLYLGLQQRSSILYKRTIRRSDSSIRLGRRVTGFGDITSSLCEPRHRPQSTEQASRKTRR
jgi:hypothetical protein